MRKRYEMPCFVLAFIVLGAAAKTSAQPVQDPLLQKLVQTPQYQANIARLFSTLPADVFQRCPSLVSAGSNVTVLQPTSFSADGYPVSGSWKQSFPISGCGNDTIINFFFVALSNEKITSVITAPGDTHANPVLQRDALNYALMEVKGKARTCTDFHLRTTRYDGRLPKANDAGSTKRPPSTASWTETWAFAACGQLFAVPLTFIPDATGTQIVAAPAVETSR